MTAVTERAVTEVLQRARARIAPPDRWTAGAGALNAEGAHVAPWAPGARRWCAVGALRRECRSVAPDACGHVAVNHSRELLIAAIVRLGVALGAPPRASEAQTAITLTNDGPGHEVILAAFDEAIRQK